MRELTQGTAANVMVFMTSSTDHVTGLAGLTLTVTASKDGAAFASVSPAVTDRGSGWYNLALTTSHTDTLGDLCLHVTGTLADPSDLVCRVIAMNKADSVRAGLTALPSAAAGASGGLPLIGSSPLTNLDAAVSSRSTYAGGDTSGTTTLLSRLTSGRATSLDNLDAAVTTRLASAGYTAPDNATVALIYGVVDTEVAAIKAKTDSLTFTSAGKVDATIQAAGDLAQAAADKVWAAAARTLTASLDPTAAQVADKLLGRSLAAGADGGRTVQDALRMLRNKWSVSGGTLTVTLEDDSTTAWTSTLTATAGANPITASDPA